MYRAYLVKSAIKDKNCHHLSFCQTQNIKLSACEAYFISACFFTLCIAQMYGAICSQSCGNCSNGETCHHVNGTCLNGCNEGFTGICVKQVSMNNLHSSAVPIATDLRRTGSDSSNMNAQK